MRETTAKPQTRSARFWRPTQAQVCTTTSGQRLPDIESSCIDAVWEKASGIEVAPLLDPYRLPVPSTSERRQGHLAGTVLETTYVRKAERGTPAPTTVQVTKCTASTRFKEMYCPVDETRDMQPDDGERKGEIHKAVMSKQLVNPTRPDSTRLYHPIDMPTDSVRVLLDESLKREPP